MMWGEQSSLRIYMLLERKSLLKYIFIPFLAWVFSGCLKFCINYFCFGSKAKELIGYGGFPSTHTTIVASVVFSVGLSEGFKTPVFSLGLGLLLVLIIDAHGLRRNVGKQSMIINQLTEQGKKSHGIILRERMGHTWLEIGGGLVIGFIVAVLMNML